MSFQIIIQIQDKEIHLRDETEEKLDDKKVERLCHASYKEEMLDLALDLMNIGLAILNERGK